LGAIVETSKLTFNVQELPEGRSSRTVKLEKGDLVLNDDVKLSEGLVEIGFYKTNHFVEVKFDIDVETELKCDRSLRSFLKRLKASYHMLFEPGTADDTESEKGAVRQIPADSLQIGVEREVRDTILLEVPVRKIHPDYLDSDGNPEKFEIQKYGTKADEDEVTDPRWAALKKLK
jgi:uncharacterized metal-binding protein YceD (DUF177 family)